MKALADTLRNSIHHNARWSAVYDTQGLSLRRVVGKALAPGQCFLNLGEPWALALCSLLTAVDLHLESEVFAGEAGDASRPS